MPLDPANHTPRLTGHALRNAHLRERSLARAQTAPPLARAIVTIRAETLGMTRLELARRSGISRGTLRDLELGVHTPTRRILQQLLDFCSDNGVAGCHLEEVHKLYAGAESGLGPVLARRGIGVKTITVGGRNPDVDTPEDLNALEERLLMVLPLAVMVVGEHPQRHQQHDQRRQAEHHVHPLGVAPGLFSGRHRLRLVSQ